jgi:hypothetical protein
MKPMLIALSLTLAARIAAASDLDCEATAPRNVIVPAAGITRVVIVGRAGSLKVTGRDGAAEIRATGTACASSSKLLADIKLVGSRHGSEFRIEAETPDVLLWGSASLPFEVILPTNVVTVVEDGSGELTIAHTGELHVTDGSGGLSISDVRGNLEVDDGSGELTIRNVTGDVRVKDGSGAISVDHVGGSVSIPDDGSGSLSVHDVRHNVSIDSKGSGHVSVTDVGGNFSVSSSGGTVEYERVAGKVNIPSRNRR